MSCRESAGINGIDDELDAISILVNQQMATDFEELDGEVVEMLRRPLPHSLQPKTDHPEGRENPVGLDSSPEASTAPLLGLTPSEGCERLKSVSLFVQVDPVPLLELLSYHRDH